MSLSIRFFLCPVVFLGAIAGAAGVRDKADGAPPRLALVSTTLTPAIQNILTLAEAKISTDSAVQLVDRREIAKILAEQKLSTAGFVKEDQVLKVGKLLGVNLFAVLEAAPNSKDVVGLVIFDAATGTRVWDAAVPHDSLDAMTAGVRKAVQGAAAKYQQRNKGLKTVCVAAVRNAGLPPSKDAFCETIGFFLEREFVSSPSLALLERTRLDQVVKERNLPTDSPLKGLLASLVRVELEIGPASDGKGVAATALLFDAQGKKLGKASVNAASANAADVAQALQAKVLKLLEAAPAAGAPDRSKEAIRFVQESDFWSFLGERPRAIRCLEAAVALHPAQREHHKKLIHLYRGSAEQILYRMPTEEEVMQSLRWMQRALDEALRYEGERRRDAKDMEEPLSLSAESYVATLLKRVKSPSPRCQELIPEIQQRNSQLVDARLRHTLAKVRNQETLGRALAVVAGIVIKRDYTLPAELKSVWKKHLTHFFSLADRIGTPLTPEHVPQIYNVIRVAADVGVAPKLIKDFRAVLMRSKDPYVILYERLVEQQIQLDLRKPTAAKVPQVLAAHREFVQAQLATDAAQDVVFCWHCYHCYERLVSETVGMSFEHYSDPAAKEICALADFMIERKEFQSEIANRAARGTRKLERADAARGFAYAERLLQLLESPECRVLVFFHAGNPDSIRIGFRANLRERRLGLLSTFPDLAPRITPWSPPVEFMDVHGKRNGIVRLNKPIVHENVVYAVLLGQEKEKSGQFVQLCRFALADGKKTLLGKVAVDTGYKPEQRREADRLAPGESSLFVIDGLIYDGRYYVGTRDKGIFIFPLDGGKVEHLHSGNGLPADSVQSLTCLDGLLFAGLGSTQKPSYFVAHDLKSGRTKLLASSSRVEVQSPFDDLPLWGVAHLCADAPRHRVLAFFISLGGTTTGKRERFGLWEIAAKDGRFRQVFAEDGFHWMSPVFAGKILVAARQNVLVDLKSNQAKATALTTGVGPYPFVESRLPLIRELLAAGQAPRELCHGHFVHDGWLWTSNDFGRVSLDGKKKELLASPRTKSKEPFFPHESFQLVGENQILMADAHGMWLATLVEGRK